MSQSASVADQLHVCAGELQRGELTVERLRQLAEECRNRCQDILYIQTLFSSVDSPVNGMSMIADGKVQHLPEDPEEWPYQSVLDAINDGWRVISFPNMALMLVHSRTYGIVNEVILERIL